MMKKIIYIFPIIVIALIAFVPVIVFSFDTSYFIEVSKKYAPKNFEPQNEGNSEGFEGINFKNLNYPKETYFVGYTSEKSMNVNSAIANGFKPSTINDKKAAILDDYDFAIIANSAKVNIIIVTELNSPSDQFKQQLKEIISAIDKELSNKVQR
ncbi:MAG: hypothetical protein V2I97_08730 [Desulfococcaceae bacterium]|jgi:hypothetical protein|nr:hypothetical protein [Desulfococcaceae bacterium]